MAEKKKPEKSAIPRTKEGRPAPGGTAPKVSPSNFQRLRRQLHRAKYENALELQKAKGKEFDRLIEEKELIDKAYNKATDLERTAYLSDKSIIPTDWDVTAGQPKNLTKKEILQYDPIDPRDLPENFKVTKKDELNPIVEILDIPLTEEEPPEGREGTPEEQRKELGLPTSDKFINQELRKILKDIGELESRKETLDPDNERDSITLDQLDKTIDSHKDRLKYFQQAKNVGVKDKWLSEDYKKSADKLRSFLTPEQLKAVKEGQPISERSIGDLQGYRRAQRDLGRTRDKILQSSADEMDYLSADPSHTIKEYRALPLEERQELTQDIKRDNFQKKILGGIEDFYNTHPRRDKNTPWQDVTPDEQQKWLKQYAAQEAKKGEYGLTGGDIYKWMFGGGEQFLSKNPPELQQPMIRAGRRGLATVQQAKERIGEFAQQDPYERLYGTQSSTLRNLITGEGKAPQVPELPQEYPFTPRPPQADIGSMLAQSPQSALMLGQLLQQGAQQQPTSPQNVDALINSRLSNLLNGEQ